MRLGCIAWLLAFLVTGTAAGPQQVRAAPSPASSDVLPERRILVMLKLPPEHYRPGSDYGGVGGYGDPGAAAARRRLAARLAREQGLLLRINWPMPILGIDCMVMTVPGDEPLEQAAARMSRQPGVAWAQPMQRFEAQALSVRPMPNDRLFLAQPSAILWRLADLHRLATGRGVKVAVVDSLIDPRHPDLQGQLLVNLDMAEPRAFAPELHGTGVAGIIAARPDNRVGIAGVAPGARLMGLRACGQHGAAGTLCDSISLARALIYAIERRADIVNLSLTGPDDLLLARLIEAGQKRGAIVVAAVDLRTGAGFPAMVPGVVAVAANGLAAPKRGVYTAPGRDIPTTGPGRRWYLASGNSFAAAHVSGLLALTRELARGPVRLEAESAAGGRIMACRTLLRTAARQLADCSVDD